MCQAHHTCCKPKKVKQTYVLPVLKCNCASNALAVAVSIFLCTHPGCFMRLLFNCGGSKWCFLFRSLKARSSCCCLSFVILSGSCRVDSLRIFRHFYSESVHRMSDGFFFPQIAMLFGVLAVYFLVFLHVAFDHVQ